MHSTTLSQRVSILLEKGVTMPIPESVFIDERVDLSRISGEGVTLYPGTRIMGADILIMPGAQLGFEAPVTLDNAFVGPGTQLKGGFFQKCVFVGKNSFGSGGHVRGGTILEEEASAAHTVGLKQTILFPFVTLGSLINFCDCLMAGGTSRKDHSEVGSSYIHFNYTPNQDKATPSMMGNVHHGVMLNCRPVFLGGQGGLVGPCRLPFGTITAAGTIWRKDVSVEGRLLIGGGMREASIPRREGVYTGAKRIFSNNVNYIASLMALGEWYRHVRSLFFTSPMEKALLAGMLKTLQSGIDERMKRLDDFVMRLDRSLSKKKRTMEGRAESGEKKETAAKGDDVIVETWLENQQWLMAFNGRDDLTELLMHESALPSELGLSEIRKDFKERVEKGIETNGCSGYDYVRGIQALAPSDAEAGTTWLKAIQNGIEGNVRG